MVANLCFLFSSSFRYVKFQVTGKVCQSGNRGQTTKKTRRAAAATKAEAQGLKEAAEPPVALGTLIHKLFFKISPERTQETRVPGRGCVFSPVAPGRSRAQ